MRRRLLLAVAVACLAAALLFIEPASAAASATASPTSPFSSPRATRKETAEMARRARRRREENDAAVQRGERAMPPLPEALNISILTWNMCEKSPPMSDVAALAGMGLNASDITVLGVQEVENLKPRRHEGSRSREWRRLVVKTLGRTHALLSLTSLGGLQLAVLAKKSIVPHVSPLHICEVPCGVGNVLYNKGAQAALFRIGGASSWSSTRRKKGGGMGRLEMGTSFLFVNAHLAAHQHKVEERNMDVDRVMTELQSLLWFHLTAGRGGSNSATTTNGHKNNGRPRPVPQPLVGHSRARDVFQPEELVGKVDHMFFFGDLNYRLELPREDVEIPLRRVKSGRITQAEAVARMLEYDQLGIEKAKGRVFAGLEEPPVGFLPTFKFNKGRDNYDTSPKRRAPAWTDRVLYKPCAGAVECTHYDSVPFCRHSDHRPVLARFRVALRPREEEVDEGKDGGGRVDEDAEIEKEEAEEEGFGEDDESTEEGGESGYESDDEEEGSEY